MSIHSQSEIRLLAYCTFLLFFVLGCESPQQNLAEANSSLVKEGVLYHNGEPTFPFGFYFEWAGDRADHIHGLKQMADYGFNYSFITLGQKNMSLEDYQVVYDTAAALGISLIGEHPFHQFPNGKTAIEALKNKPACSGWAVADDAMGHTGMSVYESVNKAKALDSLHLSYISSNGVQRSNISLKIEDFTYSGLDAIGMQTYPIPSLRHWWVYEPGVKDIRMVFYRCERMVRTYEPLGKLSFVNNQAFKWRQKEDDRYPTAAESDNMIYQSIIAGVKGVLAYTFQGCCRGEEFQEDRPSILDFIPEWKPVYIRANQEIQSLKDFILFGERTTLVTDPSVDWVFSAIWEYEGKKILIATNCSSEPQKAMLPVPGFPLTGAPKKIFEYRDGGLKYEKGILTGEMAPLSTHFYYLNN